MSTLSYALFDTAIGPCAVAWGERGLIGVQLPEGDAAGARTRLQRRFPGAAEAAPPPAVAEAIEAMTALLDGEARDLSGIALDMDGIPEFRRRIYDILLTIPHGQTLTYGEVAARLGDPGAARVVGEAMGKNPFPIIVPCHRVVAAGGKLGGFSARGGASTKQRMLVIEHAKPAGQPDLF
jgi:methylated-DNA-[protein]-cysteine S-methyltransferase